MMKENIHKILSNNENISLLGNTYISQKNMFKFLECIKIEKEVPNILITPYLVNTVDSKVFELMYYEFDIDVRDGAPEVIKFDNNNNNEFPDELVKGIYPGIKVSKHDYEFAYSELNKYLNSMNKMNFFEVINHYPFFKKEDLYYQVF